MDKVRIYVEGSNRIYKSLYITIKVKRFLKSMHNKYIKNFKFECKIKKRFNMPIVLNILSINKDH